MRAATLGLALGVACGGGAAEPGMGRAGPPPLSACQVGVVAIVGGLEFADFQAAADAAVDSDVMYICPGQYLISDTIRINLINFENISIFGLGPNTNAPVLVGENHVLEANVQYGKVLISNITFEGSDKCSLAVSGTKSFLYDRFGSGVVVLDAVNFVGGVCLPYGAMSLSFVSRVDYSDSNVQRQIHPLHVLADDNVVIDDIRFSDGSGGIWVGGWSDRNDHIEILGKDLHFNDLVGGIPLAFGHSLGVNESVSLERVQFLRNHGHSVWPSVESVEPLRLIAGGGPARMDAVLDDVLFDGNTGEFGTALGVTAFDGAAVDLTLRDTRIWRSRTQALVGPNNQFMTLGYPVATRLPDATGTVTVTLDGVDFGAGATANERQEIAGCDQPVGGLVSGTVVRQFGASRGCP